MYDSYSLMILSQDRYSAADLAKQEAITSRKGAVQLNEKYPV